MLTLRPIDGLGEIVPGTDLGVLLVNALGKGSLELTPRDVVVVAQKVVSKAEGRFRDLATIHVSERARELAKITGKDPRLVEVVLSESTEVLRARRNVLIVRHRLGLVMAQAGVDRSNVPGTDRVLLLPIDPDRSAQAIREAFARLAGVAPGVIVSDSFGRPWRLGTTNVAIGAAGVPSLWDRRGEHDREGRVLEVTQVAWADAVAGAAGIVMGEGAEGIPAVVVSGCVPGGPERSAAALLRPSDEDLFR